MGGHGGNRAGAGRPQKFDTETMLDIGGACERRWREESELAKNVRLAALPKAEDIRALHAAAQAIPVQLRKAWSAGEGREEHSGDIKAFLHARYGTQFDEAAGDYEGDPKRGDRVSTMPARGARKRIIKEIAQKHDLTENQVRNLWAECRRHQRSIIEEENQTET